MGYRGLRSHQARPRQVEARVLSPVRERSALAESRVRVENVQNAARPVGASFTRSILSVLIPHPNPLPLGRGGRSRSVIDCMPQTCVVRSPCGAELEVGMLQTAPLRSILNHPHP